MFERLSTPAAIDSPAMRQAGRELLSLAWMDARNHTLSLLARLESHAGPVGEPSPAWWVGHAAWFAESWIGRNTQRNLGPRCPPAPTRLASIEPQADRWWHPSEALSARDLPDPEALRAWLLETLESTLELLQRTPETDDALYFFRLALFHEDAVGERLVQQAQHLGVDLGWPDDTRALAPRDPIALPATRWTLGRFDGGFHFDHEAGAHAVDVPAFEIDAQAVTWAQFAEFVADGGYDRAELWQAEGWDWLQSGAEPRRAPRHVEQIGAASGAVLLRRFGRVVRMAGHQPAVHLSWWEADAWARWARRRLATEVEWEIAAHQAGSRGFRWGQAHEWTSNRLQPWPGYVEGPWAEAAAACFGRARVLRGGSFATRARLLHPRARGYASPGDDARFTGFRTCAL